MSKVIDKVIGSEADFGAEELAELLKTANEVSGQEVLSAWVDLKNKFNVKQVEVAKSILSNCDDVLSLYMLEALK